MAEQLGCSPATVGKWRARFLEHRLDGLVDEPRPGRPPTITVEQVEDVVVATLEATPTNATHWSRTKMAERPGCPSPRSADLAQVRAQAAPGRHFKLSTDPLFIEKVHDVVGLYLNPPEARSCSASTRRRQIQALARSQPALPMMPGMPERRTHDYVRHGTTTLFAAFNIADGTVITTCTAGTGPPSSGSSSPRSTQRSRRSSTIHLICDNYATHKPPIIKTWLAPHPGSTCTSPRPTHLGQPGRAVLRLRHRRPAPRADHRSVQALEADIRTWVTAWNDDPKPFVWTKTADQILGNLGRLLQRTSNSGH